MKRINVLYDGCEYSIGDRDLSVVRQEISDAVGSGKPYWLHANFGAGSVRLAELLITPGVGISLMGIDPHEDGSGT